MNGRTYTSMTDYANGATLPLRRATMPLTGAFIFIYVVTLIFFDQNPATQRIADITSLALVLVFVVELISRRGKLCVPAPLTWYAVFLCFITFQMIWSPGSINMLVSLYQILVVAIVVVNYEVMADRASAVEYAFYSQSHAPSSTTSSQARSQGMEE